MNTVHNVLKSPSPSRAGTRAPLVAASILSADFARLEDDCRVALDAGANLLHLDVMDGHFVPNLTMGPALCGSLRRAFPQTCLDVHLMVTNPAIFVTPFAKAGANHFTFHIEAVPDPIALANAVRDAGMTAGLAINPPTDVHMIVPFLDHFEMILIMSVNPGFSGQSFIASALDKARTVKRLLRPEQWLEVDGGVNAQTSSACIEAGFNVLVAASAIFNTDDYAASISALRAGVPS